MSKVEYFLPHRNKLLLLVCLSHSELKAGKPVCLYSIQFDVCFGNSVDTSRGITRGHNSPGAESLRGASNDCGGEKSLKNVTLLSLIQYISFRKTLGSNIRASNLLLPRALSKSVTPLDTTLQIPRQPTRRANASLLEQQWRGACEASSTKPIVMCIMLCISEASERRPVGDFS